MSPSSQHGQEHGRPQAALIALCARIMRLQRKMDRVAAAEQQAESEGDLGAAGRYHHKQVALVQRRYMLIDQLCRLPATTRSTRQAKVAAFMTLIVLNDAGVPEHPDDWPLWSALKDLAVDWADAASTLLPTPRD